MYGDGTLCLHLEHEWTPDMLIVHTTLPWTSEWLINYEIWKATGELVRRRRVAAAAASRFHADNELSEEAESPTQAATARG